MITFSKWHGAGNDFVAIDNRSGCYSDFLRNVENVQAICSRRTGVGADGLLEVRNSTQANFHFVYYNRDGKEGSLCGNGCRCAIAFAKHLGVYSGTDVSFVAYDGIHRGRYFSLQSIHVKMADVDKILRLGNGDFFLNTGSDHYITFVDEVDSINVPQEGKKIRDLNQYKDIGGTNANFAQKLSSGKARVRTFERGVEDETMACGTACVAVALTLHYEKQLEIQDISSVGDTSENVHTELVTSGGNLEVTFKVAGIGRYQEIFLIGPAAFVFQGEYKMESGS